MACIRVIGKRSFSLAVKYSMLGDPLEVLKLETVDDIRTDLKGREVALKFLAAPINPSDFNMVEGVYGVKAKLPAVGGNEGVAEVTKIGPEVSTLKEGDWVIPSYSGFGTWRQQAIEEESKLIKIPKTIPIPYAATIAVNPCSSYRLLRDFVSLKPGDVLIQNAANSMVGMGIIQMAREMGIKTVNIVRVNRIFDLHVWLCRPDADDELRLLTNLGGDVNLFDNMLNTPLFKEIMADLPPCKLAINATGGESAVEMARALTHNGTMVTYGGMSRQAPVIPLDVIIDKNLKLKGFWMNIWNEKHSIAERQVMLNDIVKLIEDNQLGYFYEMHDMDDFDYALERSLTPHMRRKVVLNLDYPDRFKEHDARPDSDYEMFKYPLVNL